eukprot:CAMPEP_0178411254 /NCGR_PEP_ID=MMETSP0689_2-20121128/21399_1 /TAXON_ID=160604 /ORGANISM="Amphidinium massartii, Strain CS-259" /LENGTH=203 /DNA_ID=CAMNT_0020032453 /DNA_START=166 /DNA_END=777 /DNA_ORIENTATION=+
MVAPAASRGYAAAAAAGKKPKMEDGTLEGRYATALFMATSNNLDKVYADLAALRSMMKESAEFKLMIETPGIDPDTKVAALEAVCKKTGADPAVMNFLKVLVENKRMHLFSRCIELYEAFYRAEKNEVPCEVTSAEELTTAQKSEVKSAMEKRAGKGSTLLMDYKTNPALLGGLVVKLGEAVYDSSVSTKLERLQAQLLAPMS